MIAIVLAALSWTNAGWADNPAPPPRRASWAADPFQSQVLPASLKRDTPKPEPVKPAPPPPTPIKAPRPKPKPPVARTSPVYYLPDYSGKKWYGPDLNWLRTHVANVNAAATARYAPVYQPVFQYGSPCANGSCPR